jgi:hypothetical protein
VALVLWICFTPLLYLILLAFRFVFLEIIDLQKNDYSVLVKAAMASESSYCNEANTL